MDTRNTTADLVGCSVIKLGDGRLRQSCAVVESLAEANHVAKKLWATLAEVGKLYDFTRGVGIAAPQIGEMVRIFVADVGGIRKEFINPHIFENSGEIVPVREGCLSFFSYRGMVPRFTWVKISATDLTGKPFEIKSKRIEDASLYQHETDHLNGVLYIDRLPNKEADLIAVAGMPTIP